MSKKTNPLWTRDFTILTVGSVVSMFGNAMTGFAMSLMVLDLSQSTMLYAIYIAMYTLPQLIMPIVSGAVLDRRSRKKTIYTLDFISAGLYLLLAGLLATGWFSFPVFAAYCFVLGSIQSMYFVAYDSFYPLLISEGNYQKAYSIASVLETMSAVMVPVSAFLYKRVGLAPLMAANAVCFLLAAVIETRIGADEEYIEKQKSNVLEGAGKIRQVLYATREGFAYLAGERGLLAVAVYFLVISVTGGASNVITLPWFRDRFPNGEYIYMLVWGGALVGRAIGGAIHYRLTIRAEVRYRVALAVYLLSALLEAFYLFCPVPVMTLMCFGTGIAGVTSYTIRISATQSYVPDEKKGRFNGAFNMLSALGALQGELTGGALAELFNSRTVLMSFMLAQVVAALIIIGGSKKHVEKVYNRTQ